MQGLVVECPGRQFGGRPALGWDGEQLQVPPLRGGEESKVFQQIENPRFLQQIGDE